MSGEIDYLLNFFANGAAKCLTRQLDEGFFGSLVWNRSLIIWVYYLRGYAIQSSFRYYLTNQYDEMQILYKWGLPSKSPCKWFILEYVSAKHLYYMAQKSVGQFNPKPSWTPQNPVDQLLNWIHESMRENPWIHKRRVLNETSWSLKLFFAWKLFDFRFNTLELYYLYLFVVPSMFDLFCFSQVCCI